MAGRSSGRGGWPTRHAASLQACSLFALLVLCAIVPACAQATARANSVPRSDSTSKQQLQRAVSLAEHGDKKQALEIANRLLEKDPDLVPALKLRGMLLKDSGRGAEASEDFARALQLSPRDPVLLFQLGMDQLAAAEYGQAIDSFLRHLRILPKDSEALFYLAQSYHLNGQDDLGLKAIRESLRIEPKNAQVLQKYGELLCASGDNEAALPRLLKAQQLDNGLDGIEFDIGLAHYNNMNFSDTARYAAKAVEKQPANLHALALLAAAEVKLSQYREAQQIFERILDLRGDDTASLLGLGHCQVELKQFREGIDTLQQLLQIDPGQIRAHYLLSQAYTGVGRPAEAKHEAELHAMMQQMSLAPTALGSEGTKALWNQAGQLLAEHREQEALLLFQHDSKGSPADSYVFVGSIYLSDGDTKDGLRTLRRAVEMDATVRGAHTYIGQVALHQDDPAMAEKEFQAELANDRNYLPALAELGAVRYRQQQWAEAVDLLLRSRTTMPRSLYMLCDAYFHIGKASDAGLTAETLAAVSMNDRKTMQDLIELLNRNDQAELAQRLSRDRNP